MRADRTYSLLRLLSCAGVAFLLTVATGFTSQAWAADYTAELSWTPVGQASGYRIVVRPGNDPAELTDVGSLTSGAGGLVWATIPGLPLGPTSYMSIATYDEEGTERGRSNELAIDYATAAMVVDSDEDGLLDGEEDTDLDGIVDAGETDPADSDSDDDGYDDGEEVAAGTDPNHPGSFGAPVCGNDVLESDEECDDGNAGNGDACLATCVPAACGDGYLWGGSEECDDGAFNSDADPDACRGDCTPQDICGDVDQDGDVTASDALAILQVAIGLGADCRYSQCDTDGDNMIVATDAIRTLQSALGLWDGLDCDLMVTLMLENAADLTELDLAVDYAGIGSTFVGELEAVSCENLAGGDVSMAFSNETPTAELLVASSSVGVISGPVELARCRFHNRRDAGDTITAEEFWVDVVDWTGGAAPDVTVAF